MQSLAPSNAGEGDKIGSNVASVSCHASTAPLKSNHVESHGDKKTGLGDKKTLSLPLRKVIIKINFIFFFEYQVKVVQ